MNLGLADRGVFKAPLAGITIIDLTRLLPGPFCSLILSELGARVIKIEDPIEGDYLRQFSPYAEKGEGTLFHWLNRNKENVVIDLKSPTGREVFLRLVRRADILLESFRPGVLDRLGISDPVLKKINRHLTVVSITSYGQTADNRHKAGHDLNYLSLSGLLSGSCPPPVQWADLVGGGLWGVIAVLSALVGKGKRRKGRHIDLAMTDAMIFVNAVAVVLSKSNAKLDALSGVMARYRLYRTSDDLSVALAALESKFWNRFCDLVGKEHLKDEAFSFPDREPSVHRELELLFRGRSRQEWTELGEKHDICLTPVLSPQEVAARSGKNLSPRWPLPGMGGRKTSFRIRKKGEDNRRILKELGYSKKQGKT